MDCVEQTCSPWSRNCGEQLALRGAKTYSRLIGWRIRHDNILLQSFCLHSMRGEPIGSARVQRGSDLRSFGGCFGFLSFFGHPE